VPVDPAVQSQARVAAGQPGRGRIRLPAFESPVEDGRVGPSRAFLIALGVLAAAVSLGLVPLLATSDFLTERALWIELNLVIGWGFAGVGLFAWYRRPDNRVGALMVATAFAWFLTVAGNTDVDLLFTIGQATSNLFVGTAVHLLLAFPSGRLESTVDRVLVGAAYAATSLGFLPFILLFNPEQFGCATCPENLFLVGDGDVSFIDTYTNVLSAVGITILLSVLLRLGQRWRDANAPLRRAIGPLFLAGAALMAALSVLLATMLVEDTTSAEDVTKATFYVCLIPFGLVPYLFLAGLLRGRWIRGRGLGALVRRLSDAPTGGGLREDLARALGDPTLEVAYWIPEAEHFVDAEGRRVDPPKPGGDRAVSEVERDGRRIAAIIHDPALLEDEWHLEAASGAAALALENERLEAELRAKVEELRASQRRVVEVGLRERQRLERDLHDGAQQRLVSLALQLRLAQQSVRADPKEAERVLEESRAELDETLKELREFARGIHPAVLSDRGLGPAIEALARRAPLPVHIGAVPARRLPEHVELAAYYVVSEALTNIAKYAAASRATIAVVQDNGRLTVEVADDGIGGADPAGGTGLRGLTARLAIIEGRLEVESVSGRGTTIRARIPCD
jgi:signal transduction histidine kinase